MIKWEEQGGLGRGKRYTEEEGQEALKLAEEIGAAGRGDPAGGTRFFRQAPETVIPGCKHRFIRAHLGRWPVSAMCRVLHVSEQGYYHSASELYPEGYDF